MWVLVLLLLIPLALLPPAHAADPGQPCPSEMNKVKDLLELNCTGQALSTVPSDLPADTGILLLNANNLVSLSTAAFLPLTQLQDLDLSDNGLAALYTGPLLPSLRELILSYNALGALPALQGLPALTRLAVAHNNLAVLAPGAFRAVPQLQDLDLRGNQLRTLPQEAFAGLRMLKDLDLSDNLLQELPRELLQDLQRLETLWLSGNHLQTLPTDFFPEGHFFAYVFLTENPWHCDCDLRYLRDWIRENEGSVYQPERGLEKTKVELAPEKVLCHSPPEHQRKPVIRFKPNCGNVGDADEEEEYEYDDGEGTMEKAAVITSPPHPPIPTEQTTLPHVVTRPPLTTTRPPLSTPCPSTLALSTSSPMPASTRAPSTTTPAPPSPTITPTPTPSTATILITAPASTPHRPTTFVSTTSPPTTVSTRPPSTSSRPQTRLATSTTNTYTTLMVFTGAFFTTSTAAPSTAMLETSSIVGPSSPPLVSTTPVVSTAMPSTHAPTPPAPLNTTQPAPSPPPASLPLCPCSIPGPAVPILRSWAGAEGPQGGQWVLRHCCLLHWVLYLASLALLGLTLLALVGWLVWMCLVGRSSWHQSLQSQEVRNSLLRWKESAGSPTMHLSSFKKPLQHRRFCTIKEVELCPEVVTSYTYCTIKDLGVRCSPPASSSFCTTKELWVHHSPPKASVTNLRSLRIPSAYSLDRGVKAIGDVRVKYAGNTL
ncbi:platelet glycoprotein Ib alpha chain [Caloenas nicobarica]|uniref:platelet glycoprotein Ib alpha chain n=1 Tax=Caloenas nicobarica TaxID=187106 RepID=UPI0032B86D0D